MSNNITKTLLQMKEEIENQKMLLARLEGELDSKYKQLKTDFSCSDSAQAQRKLDKMDKDIDRDESRLKSAINKLQEEYDW